MELKRLDKKILKLWYIHAAIASLALLGVFASTTVALILSNAPEKVTLAVLLGVGLLIALLLAFILILPAPRFKVYEWGYDSKRIIVKQGVIFRQRVVIPVCQIQDLHRTQGPIMALMKLSGVTISTAGSNFDISTLTTEEADLLIDKLEGNLESRIEEMKNEEI